jgi:hypothetical protein
MLDAPRRPLRHTTRSQVALGFSSIRCVGCAVDEAVSAWFGTRLMVRLLRTTVRFVRNGFGQNYGSAHLAGGVAGWPLETPIRRRLHRQSQCFQAGVCRILLTA